MIITAVDLFLSNRLKLANGVDLREFKIKQFTASPEGRDT